MEYGTAKSIRGRSLSSMVTQGIRSGRGVGSSIRGAISQKMRARMTGIKEKFDPMNVAKFLTGGSNLAPAILGRLTGRSQSDINYFSGGRKTATRVGKSSMLGRMSEDSVGSLSELFTFIKKSHEQDLRIRESERSFQEERVNEDQRRHNEFIKILKDYVGQTGTATIIKEGEKSGGLFDFIKKMISDAIKGAIETIQKMYSWIKDLKILQSIAPFLSKLAGIITGGSYASILAFLLPAAAVGALLFLIRNQMNKIESNPFAEEFKDNPYAMKLRGEQPTVGAAAQANTNKTVRRMLRNVVQNFVNSNLTDEELVNNPGSPGADRATLQKWLAENPNPSAEWQAPVAPSAAGMPSNNAANQLNTPDGGMASAVPTTSGSYGGGVAASPGMNGGGSYGGGVTASPDMMGNQPSLSTQGTNATPVSSMPQSAAVYPASSENAMLNMGGGYVDSVTPIVASSVNNTSTDDVISAPASIRDSTVILSRVFRQSSAYV